MTYDYTIAKYFKKHSNNFSYHKKHKVQKKYYKYFIIIPVYNEYNYILETLNSINNNADEYLDNLLVVLVINNSIGDSPEIKNNNYKTHQLINEQKYKYEYLVIDCYSIGNELNKKYSGVGISRKIGMDFIVYYSKPNSLIFSLDADTLISKKYIETISNIFEKFKIKVCTINFYHQSSQNIMTEKAIRLYETKLKQIARKIKNAGSPYGYVSMGSAIACTAEVYLSVGGMSKKKATEDFYFLQALAKHTSIYQINKILVYPSSRCEQRVYLGTGYRLQEFQTQKQFRNLDYSRNAYKNLKEIIRLCQEMWGVEYNIIYNKINASCDANAVKFLSKNNFKDVWIKFCHEAKNQKQFLLFFNQWFDALKTIKFLKKLS